MKQLIIFDFYKTIYNPKTDRLYRGTRTLLKKLQLENYLLWLITTKSTERQKQIRKFQLDSYFEKIIICPRKTNKVFRRLLEIPPKKTMKIILVGDNLNEEISIGQSLGIETIVVNPEIENPTKTILRRITW